MKNKISDLLRLFIFVFIMTMGFFFTYAFIWFAMDLPIVLWSVALLVAITVLTEYGFYKWICKEDKSTEVRDTHWATEQAYKNGYAAGFDDGKAESVHGSWQANRSEIAVEYTCSQCGMTFCEADPAEKPPKYCSECGSKNE